MRRVALAVAAAVLLSSCPEPFGSFTNPVDSTNKVPVTGISMSASAASIEVGETLQLTASVRPSTATIKAIAWSSANPAIATVSSAGLVTGVAVGGATISARSVDGGLSAACTVTVDPISVVSVSLKPSATIFAARTERLVPTILPANAADQRVSWTSSDETKARVANDGTVTGVAAGQATITVTTLDGGKRASCSVTVIPVPVAGIALDRTAAAINVRQELQLSAAFTPADATDQALTWTSSDSGVAAVSASGLVTGAGEGEATITARARDGGHAATCALRVNRVEVTGIALDQGRIDIPVRGTAQLSAAIAPANATNLGCVWASGNSGMATVSNSGFVTGVAEGTTWVSATSSEGAFAASCEVAVHFVPVIGISIDPSNETLYIGDTLQLVSRLSPANATDQGVAWSSDAPAVAWVDDSGLVSALALGTATISASAGNAVYRAARTIRVIPIEVTGITLDKSELSILLGQSGTLSADVAPSNATDRSVIWSSSDEAVATVSGSGAISTHAEGWTTITATTVDGGLQAACSLHVYFIHVMWISMPSYSPMMRNGTLWLTLDFYPSDATNKAVWWSSSNTSVATVSGGKVSTRNVYGSTVITATTYDGGKTASCTVEVKF